MDNKKIGKLIADLRKKKGLTQQELGDKVGVGFRAVSKWERGLTLPDITIINELSKILGISSDELLSGEVKKKNKENNKISPKILITLFSIIIVIIIFASILAYHNNKTYTYNIDSTSDEYYVEGQVILHKNNIRIVINELNFLNKDFLETQIENYEYQIMNDEELIVGYGKNIDIAMLDDIDTVRKFVENFKVNYNGNLENSKDEIINDGLTINISFLTLNNEIITKEIETKLTISENNK